ncbi:MAG: MATE family efflux transporter [Saprospirales bacterium]|nr:MATE family efflux transporter [Saprospirales bacterium]
MQSEKRSWRSYWDIIRSSLDGTEKVYTSGSINRAIVLLAIPMVLEMAMERLFAIVDVFFVARVGVDAVATVGLTEAVVTIIYALAMGLSMAATAMVARRVGEGKYDAASWSAVQAIFIGLVVSTILGVLGWVLAEDILRGMGGSEKVLANGVGYTRIMLGGNIVITLLFLLNGIFRGAGDAALAMRSLWIANVLNILLDPFFIFGWGPFPELGVMGAAVATTIGRGVGVLFQLTILLRGSGLLKLLKRHFVINWNIIWRLVKVAAGGAGQYFIASASWVFLMRIVSQFGSEVVAGYTIAIRLIIFTILPSWGISNAAATLVGQNLGAGHPERAEASAWRAAFYNMIFLLLVAVIYVSGAPQFIRFFADAPAVVDAGALCLRIISAGYIFFAYGMVISQSFNGAGDTRTPTIINFFCFWMMEIPLGYLLATKTGLEHTGVYWAITISETTMALICIWLFRKGTWKTVQI